jgi:hypothetical protein
MKGDFDFTGLAQTGLSGFGHVDVSAIRLK